jgi:hypothetical protein
MTPYRPLPALARAALVALPMLSLPAAAEVPACGQTIVSAAQAHAAVAFVERSVRHAHAGSADWARSPLKASLPALATRIAGPTPAWRLAADLNATLGLAADGHLAMRLPDEAAATCARLPVTLGWTAAGLFVRGGDGLPTGARILAFGGRDLEALDAFSARAIPHENAYWAHSEFARLAPREDLLRALGALARDGTVAVDYLDPDGHPKSARLALGRAAAATTPAWISQQIDAGHSTGVLRLAQLEVEPALNAALRDFFGAIQSQGIRKVAIDLRGNPGGDSSVAIAVLEWLGATAPQIFTVEVRVSRELTHRQPAFDPKNVGPLFASLGLPALSPTATHYTIPAPLVLGQLRQRLADFKFVPVTKRELYLLVDGGTFSSAALFALIVRDNHLGTLVGEPIGNATSFNGSELKIDVPGLPYYLNLSTARLLRPDAAAGPAPTLAPDVFAPLTPAAAANGVDPALDYVRSR